jgi:GntR family transcriptional regulator
MARETRRMVMDELRDRIVNGLHVGRYRGGERLPSVRALAREFAVNERVVMGALGVLRDEGFVELRPRSGAYVAPARPSGDQSLPRLGVWLIGVLLQARARGLAPIDLPEFARRGLVSRRVRAACIECNDDQLHLLCTELADDYGFDTASVHLDEFNAAVTPAAVRRSDVLVTTRFHAARVQRIARLVGKPWIAVALRPDVMETVGVHLRRGAVYYVATDARYERKLRRMLAPFGPMSNLRVRILERDAIDDIPPDAPTFVMSSARERLRGRFGERGGPGHPIHPARNFSDESTKDLVTFIVRANLADMTRTSEMRG